MERLGDVLAHVAIYDNLLWYTGVDHYIIAYLWYNIISVIGLHRGSPMILYVSHAMIGGQYIM